MIDRACVSLTDACNLKCRYCHFRDKQVAGTRMPRGEAVSWVRKINDYCHESGLVRFKLGIVGSGEPLLELATVLAMLEAAESDPTNPIAFYTITNGTLATTEALARLREYRKTLSVCFSLDGPREVHDAGRSSFDREMEGISNYREVYGEAPSVNATVNLQTVNHAEEVVRFFKDEGLLGVTFSRLVDCEDPDLAISRELFDSFMVYAKAEGLASRQFRDDTTYDCTMYGRFCGVGRTNVFITPEGVYPCGRFYRNEAYCLGGFDSSLSEIEGVCSAIEPVDDGKCYYDEKVLA